MIWVCPSVRPMDMSSLSHHQIWRATFIFILPGKMPILMDTPSFWTKDTFFRASLTTNSDIHIFKTLFCMGIKHCHFCSLLLQCAHYLMKQPRTFLSPNPVAPSRVGEIQPTELQAYIQKCNSLSIFV